MEEVEEEGKVAAERAKTELEKAVMANCYWGRQEESARLYLASMKSVMVTTARPSPNALSGKLLKVISLISL